MTLDYDVIILGRGITGLSAAYHLNKAGIKKVAVLESEHVPGFSKLSAGIISGGQRDNITRVATAHGEDFAAALWAFGDLGFQTLHDFCKKNSLPIATGRRLRFVTSDHELIEVEKAVKIFSRLKIPVTLQRDKKANYLAMQDEGPLAGLIDIQSTLDVLYKNCGAKFLNDGCEQVTSNKDYEAVTLKSGKTLKCTFVVIAAHLESRFFAPEIASAIVSYADQWHEMEVNEKLAAVSVGDVFSARHGYYWGVATEKNKFHLGGARFLRHDAGIEASVADVVPKISAHLQKFAQDFFQLKNLPTITSSQALLDCIPCDELPIVGPLFTNNRRLIATGFMGQGLTMGFLAGRCLSELIATGKCTDLPRRMWPERLRSL